MQDWAPYGHMHPLLVYTLRDLRKHGLSPTHLLWHQGEWDAGTHTSKDSYSSMFLKMTDSIRKEGVDSPIYISIATRSVGGSVSAEIQQAQSQLVNPDCGLYSGPNTDVLGNDFRDTVFRMHFSERGMERFAELWLEKLKAGACRNKRRCPREDGLSDMGE